MRSFALFFVSPLLFSSFNVTLTLFFSFFFLLLLMIYLACWLRYWMRYVNIVALDLMSYDSIWKIYNSVDLNIILLAINNPSPVCLWVWPKASWVWTVARRSWAWAAWCSLYLRYRYIPWIDMQQEGELIVYYIQINR